MINKALLDRSSTCEATVTKIVARGKEYVENSPTGSPAATALLKGLELFLTCWNDLKDLLERLEKNPTDVTLGYMSNFDFLTSTLL